MDCYRGTRPYPEQRIENQTVRLYGRQGMSGTDEAVFNKQSEKPVVVDGVKWRTAIRKVSPKKGVALLLSINVG